MDRLFKSFIAVSLLILVLVSCSEKKQEPVTSITVFRNVNLIPMTDERVIENQMVLVKGKKIIAFGPSGEVAVPENKSIIDGAGAFLMPGLADMHMHTSNAWLTDDWPVCPLDLYLANAVTTIRDFQTCGTDNLLVPCLRNEIAQDSRDGPTIYTCGVILGGHQTLSDAFGTENPQKILTRLKDSEYDFIKFYSYVPREKFKEFITAAKHLGIYTAGHMPYGIGLDGIRSAGMQEIAHVEELNWELFDFDRSRGLNPKQGDRYIMFETLAPQAAAFGFDFGKFAAQKQPLIFRTVGKLQASGIPLCTNIIVSELSLEKLFKPETYLAQSENKYLPKSYLDAFRRGTTRDQQRAKMMTEKGAFIDEETNLAVFKHDMDFMWLRELHKADVPLLLATDGGAGIIGIVPGFSIHWELQLLVANGFTPYEAISTGTVNAARIIAEMTGEGDFGTIEVGKKADLILANNNPLEDVGNIRDLRGVMAAGRWYAKEKLDQMIMPPD
jgi:imidazolonepropionase-like amidohydrolase